MKAHIVAVLLAVSVVMTATGAFADGNLPVPAGGSSGIIDFDALAKHIQPVLSNAITAAAGVGAVVLAATVCWRFFRRFISG